MSRVERLLCVSWRLRAAPFPARAAVAQLRRIFRLLVLLLLQVLSRETESRIRPRTPP